MNKNRLHKRIISKTLLLIASVVLILPASAHAQIPIQISNIRVKVHDTSAEIAWETNVASSARVDFGETVSYGWYIEAGYAPRYDHRINITNIKPETTYHFQITSSNSETLSRAFDRTFKTLDKGKGEIPVISDVRVVYETGTTATIQWKTNEKTTTSIDYGFTNSYGSSRGDGALTYDHDMTLTGLTSDRTYHFRVNSKDDDENMAHSTDRTFRTTLTTQGETQQLQFSNIQPASSNSPQVLDSKVVITWKTNKLANGSVMFGTSSNGYNATYVESGPRTFDHRIEVTAVPGTQYYYRVKSRDVFNKTIESYVFSIRTPSQFATNSDTADSGATSNGLLFYARFDADVNADFAVGSSIAERKGTTNVNPTSGVNGGAVYIGPKSQLSFERDKNFHINQGTISFWYRPVWNYDDNKRHTLLTLNNAYGSESDKYFHILKREDAMEGIPNSVYFGFENSNDDDFHHTLSSDGFTPNEWTHIVVYWQYGGTSALYINGVKRVSSNINGTPPAFGQRIFIGGNSEGTYFDELSIYDHPLSDTEIKELYAGGPIELDREERVQVLGISTEDVSPYTVASALYKSPTNSKVYAILKGQKYHIPNTDAFARYGYRWEDIQVVSQQKLDAIPNVRLVKSPEQTRIYFLYQRPEKRLKWYLSSPSIFSSYPENRWDDVVIIDQHDIDGFQHASLIQTKNSEKIYRLDGTTKHEISSMEAFNRNGYAMIDVVEVSMEQMNSFTTGTPIQ